MNIALVVTDLAPSRPGGIARVATELGRSLAALGNRVVAYVLDRDDGTNPDTGGVELRRIPQFATPNPDYPVAGFSWRAFSRLACEIQTEKFDVIHSFNLNALALPWFRKRLHAAGAAAVVSSYETVMMDVRAKWTEFRDRPSAATAVQIAAELYFAVAHEKSYVRAADAVVTEDHNTRLALESLGVMSGNIRVIPSGVDLEAAASSAAPHVPAADGSRPLIGYIGRVDPRKGVQYLVRAIRTVRARIPGARLLLVGASRHGYEKVIARQIEEEGLRDCVIPIGRVPGDILPYYKLFDLIVIPSLSEGIPLTLGEAMASRRLVVATRLPGVVPFVQPPDLIHWADPGDADSLAGAIIGALEDPAREARVHRAEQFIQGYSWRDVARRHLDAYSFAIRNARDRA